MHFAKVKFIKSKSNHRKSKVKFKVNEFIIKFMSLKFMSKVKFKVKVQGQGQNMFRLVIEKKNKNKFQLKGCSRITHKKTVMP